MKCSTKRLVDVDRRGRVRRSPGTPVATDRVTMAKFLDGPLVGQTLAVPVRAERIMVGPDGCPFWVYTYAGKDGNVMLFAKQPLSRGRCRFIMYYIGETGKHPATVSSFARIGPAVGHTNKAGQGARRRAAAQKLRVEQAAWRSSDEYNGR